MSEPKYRYSISIGSTKQRYAKKAKRKKRISYKDRYVQQKKFNETVSTRLENIRKKYEREFESHLDYYNETIEGLCLRHIPIRWDVKYNSDGEVVSYYPDHNRESPSFMGTYNGRSIIVDVRMGRFWNRAPAPDIYVDTHRPFIEAGSLSYYIFYMDFGKEIYAIDTKHILKRFDEDNIRTIHTEYLRENGMRLNDLKDFALYLDKVNRGVVD
ncbi:MAG: hypothetical protein ACRC1P_10870 [Cellulosilyticaceae bacterium]